MYVNFVTEYVDVLIWCGVLGVIVRDEAARKGLKDEIGSVGIILYVVSPPCIARLR